MKNPIIEMIENRKSGIETGIASYCTANELVIEAILEQAKRFRDIVLIEATANQVNQYGGYTGMTPEDFKKFVYKIADKIDFPRERILLGGDHLGPLIWSNENEKDAMKKAVELVRLFVEAGYKKIHLDTSMRLADDSVDQPLTDETIAQRGAILYEACEQAYVNMVKTNPKEMKPVYIIGSEVPIPGGAQEAEESIVVTSPKALERTISVYKEEFGKLGFLEAFEDIVGIVVQPGVEFGDSDIFKYNHCNAAKLCKEVQKYKNVVLEGHSTDYQPPKKLKEMVADGIAILKVGPALTFALREGLFALSKIEEELVEPSKQASFIKILENVMLQNPENWKKHYHGTAEEQEIKRKYSFSDRSRYYLTNEKVKEAIEKLFQNLEEVDIPLSMLKQYMPYQYIKVREERLSLNARELVKDCVSTIVDDYNYAVKYNYVIGGAFI